MIKLFSIFKAARSDFLPASIVPFLIGIAYALNRGFPLSISKFILGLIGVVSAHLSANLLNDYYDYKTGADNKGAKVSSFFGGSRAIQEGIYTDREILKFSLFFLSIAFLCGMGIFVITKNPVFLVLMLVGGVLAVEYTAPPLRLAYNKLGELDIFLLFGVGLVMGGFCLCNGSFTFGSFLISLPIAFLVTSVIICNEIPDFKSDIDSKKHNILSLTGIKRGYIIYGLIVLLSFVAILLNIAYGSLPVYAVFIGVTYYLGIKAFFDLRDGLSDINKLIQASRFTIIQHTLVGIAVILILSIT